MDDRERKIRQRLKDDFAHYASRCLKIRTKEGKIEPFVLNKAQLHIHEKVSHQKLATGKVRAIVLKGRQQGCSTYIEGRFYWLVTHRLGVRAFILTHEEEATKNLFDMAKRYHEHCPDIVRPQTDASNARELIFGRLDSGYKLGTAGNKSVGRSSTIQYLHGSEVGFWQHAPEHAMGIMQTVPTAPDTEIFLESTANGLGNYFHEQWQLAETGQSDFIAIFVPWYWQEEYRKPTVEPLTLEDDERHFMEFYGINEEQLNWRRSKIIELSAGGIDGAKAFRQEYPFTSTEAFQTSGEDTFFDPLVVEIARKTKVEAYGPLLIGVDPARYGDDRTSIIRRQGRVAFKKESYVKKDTMEVAGIVHRLIMDEHPHKVFIDVGGLGAGVYDRLKELGHINIIVAVNGGESAINQERYVNKRAEMWGVMKEWMLDRPSSIPDDDTLHADLCGVKYKFDSKTRLLLEKKEDMKKRGLRSPDDADALALTFALPDTAFVESKKKQYDRIANDLGQSMTQMDRLRKAAYK